MQAFSLFQAIIKRRTEEIKFQARALGATIEDDMPEKKVEPLSDNQYALINKSINEHIELKGLKKWQTS